jgi:asparagine synthetase B (glutamine-hydrolysing)
VGGIIGKLSFDREVAISNATVQRMIDAVAHRGAAPVSGRHAAYSGHGIALGSWSDVAGSARVAHTERRNVRVVADSALSNAASLRRVLEDRGHLVEGSTDAELIAHAYEEWGDACAARFAGAFACAIWDEAKRRLVLARDPVGVRPLCFALYGRGIVFGSETTPLLQDPSVEREWHPEAIDAYLARGYVPAPFTVYRRVSKLEPAHMLIVQGRTLATRRYSDALDSVCSHGARQGAIERLDARLQSAVSAACQRSNGCVLLSGGVASTLVAAMAPRGGTTVTIGIEQEPSDLERVFRTAAHLGLRSEIDIATPDPAEIVRQLARRFDEPAADPAVVSQYAVFAAARQYADVAVTGLGGAALCDCAQAPPLFDEALRHRLYTRRFASQVFEGQPIAGGAGDARSAVADSLFAIADRAAAAAGLRLHHPFSEHALAATRRESLREGVARRLPRALVPPVRPTRPDPPWLPQAVQSLVPSVLLGERFDTRGIISRPALQALWAEHRRGDDDHTRRLWSLLMLELWVREFIDGDAGAQPAEHAVLVRAA